MLEQLDQNTFTQLSQTVSLFQDGVAPKITGILDSSIDLPTWSPQEFLSYEAQHLAHLQALNLPATFLETSHIIDENTPNLLLHDLGCSETGSDIKQRVKDVFQDGNHTLLVNTSGSGKTRIILEGLCQSWGFYFTCQQPHPMWGTRPSFGSADLPQLLHRILPADPNFAKELPSPRHPSGRQWSTEELIEINAKLQGNWSIAERWFKALLLARFALFETFLSEIQVQNMSSGVYTRRKWLLLQALSFPILGEDIFALLTQKIGAFTTAAIDQALKHYWAKTDGLLKDLERSNSFKRNIFLVIDEAQDGVRNLRSAFKSGLNDTGFPYENRKQRPVLRQLIHVFSHVLATQESLGCAATFVVTGTGVSVGMLREATSSTTYKKTSFFEVFRTGGFDTPESQTEYVRKYLGHDFVDSEKGQELIDRLWTWLRGRHRFTAEFIALFISNNGYQNPHTCLNNYVYSFAGFRPSDGVFKEPDTGRTIRTSYNPLQFQSLGLNLEAKLLIIEIVYRYFIRSLKQTVLSIQQIELIEYGFARYTSSSRGVLEVAEPLVLLATVVRANYSYFSLFSHIWEKVKANESTPPWNAFENLLAYYFARCFAKPQKLGTVFTFYRHGKELSSLRGRLVSLFYNPRFNRLEESNVELFDSHERSGFIPCFPGTLGENASTYSNTLKWLKHQSRSAFCFPAKNMGPDLIFVLKLDTSEGQEEDFDSDSSSEDAGVSRSRYLWVAVQAKYRQAHNELYMNTTVVKKAIQSVTPRGYFLFSTDTAETDGPRQSKKQTGIQTGNAQRHKTVLEVMDSLENRASENLAGKHSILRVVASFPQVTNLSRVKRLNSTDSDERDGHPLAVMNPDYFRERLRGERDQENLLDDVCARDEKEREKKKSKIRTMNPQMKKRLTADNFKEWDMNDFISKTSGSTSNIEEIHDQIDYWKWIKKYHWIPSKSWRTKDEDKLLTFLEDLIDGLNYGSSAVEKIRNRREIIEELLIDEEGKRVVREQRKAELEVFLDWDPEDEDEDNEESNVISQEILDPEMVEIDAGGSTAQDDMGNDTSMTLEMSRQGRILKRKRGDIE
ncbi:hypothetical protein K435DRAFT_969716 [Dendrothele bispora CBS 962.96]|uniref:Uncharacterized protein n=1 Tax=Dendrothele bispora (strain CBS 962.96) TaxID=1314807 RepID=A0A4S8LFY8_DENBC|nr:hypothetical protein K435DRAFT_969716 [Dendrothele bispora CBS 962.96]